MAENQNQKKQNNGPSESEQVLVRRQKLADLQAAGNDPFVIFDDTDVDEAVAQALGGRIANAGQICCSSKRFIVHNAIKDAFAEKLTRALSEMKLGDPMDPDTKIGPLINENAATLFRYTLIFGGVALVLFYFLSTFA